MTQHRSFLHNPYNFREASALAWNLRKEPPHCCYLQNR